MKQFIILLLVCGFKLVMAQTSEDIFKEAEASFLNEEFRLSLKKAQKAIDLDSTNVDFFILKARSLNNLERYQESYEVYCEAIYRFPYEASLYNTRGNILLHSRKYDYAIQDFTIAIDLETNDTLANDYLINRSSAKSRKRDFEGAYDDLQIAYAFNPKEVATLSNLGLISDEIGKGDETLKYLLEAIEIDPTYTVAIVNIGYKYQEMGQHEKAIEYFNKVLEFDPNEPLGFSNRSFNKYKLGDLKGAMKDINRSIKLYPENSYDYRIRALIYIEQEKIEKACEDLQISIDKGFVVSYGEEVVELQNEYCK